MNSLLFTHLPELDQKVTKNKDKRRNPMGMKVEATGVNGAK